MLCRCALRSGFARVEATFVRVEQRTPEGALQTVRYRFTSEDLPALEALIREKHGVKEVITGYVGPVIGAHTGPGVLALFFMGKHR